jgi:hypothetical protein
VAIGADEAGEQLDRAARRHPLVEAHEHHVIAAARAAVPRTVRLDPIALVADRWWQ